MSHRGPDDSGIYADGPALLAHRRLSILDLSDAGQQPMSNADGEVHVVFNGEIYNYRELREELDGYRFTSGTDTEVLLHLYEERGIECLESLRGMFAFAIWDERTERVFLARDRLGQKPLFFHHSSGALWFGSTIKAILADERVDAVPDLPAIREFLTYQYIPHPRTGFEGVQQLSPGEYLVFDDTGLKRQSYWTLSYANQSTASPTVLAERVRDELREATRLRMRSDVPLGVFLSGGLDSSIVTALMDDLSDTAVGTYSIGFDEHDYGELDFARTVADEFGTDHHEYTVTPDSMDVLPELVEHYEMPFGDASALPTYYVSKVAVDDVTVALTGDAGDENFGGYDRYTWDRLISVAKRTPQWLRQLGCAGIESLPPRFRTQRHLSLANQALDLTFHDEVERYARFMSPTVGRDAERIWNGPAPADELATLREAFDHADGPTRLDRLLSVDVEMYLPDDLLVKVDRASMAHSLEVRSPFLDHSVAELAAAIPAKYKWRHGTKKWILKRAFRDDIPASILERKKEGFSVPLDEWFRGDLREYARDRLNRLGQREPFACDGLQSTLEEHVNESESNGYRIWNLMMLDAWYERFIDK